MIKKYILNLPGIFLFWIITSIAFILQSSGIFNLSFSFRNLYQGLILVLVPLFASILLIKIYIILFQKYRNIYSYILFFLISFSSLFGFTEVLTGSHAESKNFYFYGLSFYSASLAFILFNNEYRKHTFLQISNPLLLFTGPLAVFIKDIRYKSFGNRFNYFFPYIILGIFLFQALATPLSISISLIEYTDIISSIVFAIIFELFIYTNFCGLSLMIYGICGIVGFKVPLNFQQPFSASNIIEFWRGWHISLSMVLKSLFYKPARKVLGSSAAILLVFLSSALWHGVSINFLIWGLLHAFFFYISLYFLKRGYKSLPLILMVIGIIFGRMIFADSNTERLFEKLSLNFGYSSIEYLNSFPSTFFVSLYLSIIFIMIEFFFRNKKYLRERNYKFFRLPIVQLIIICITLVSINSSIGLDFAVYGQR